MNAEIDLKGDYAICGCGKKRHHNQIPDEWRQRNDLQWFCGPCHSHMSSLSRRGTWWYMTGSHGDRLTVIAKLKRLARRPATCLKEDSPLCK